VTVAEKSAMKAACVQAAATLIAARDSGKGHIGCGGVHQACRVTLRPRCRVRLAGSSVTAMSDENASISLTVGTADPTQRRQAADKFGASAQAVVTTG
jgi:hypothetical protein